MTDEQTNEPREALNHLSDCHCTDSFVDMLMDLAYREKCTPEWRDTLNAARTIARFLEWDDVLEDLTS